jgi:hypothetical protein
MENDVRMNISMILEMAASAGDRPVVTADGGSLTAAGLLDLAQTPAPPSRCGAIEKRKSGMIFR